MTVLKELSDVTKVKQKKDEEASAFLKRLALKANDLQDNEWEKLAEPTQLWVNSALDAIQHSKPLPTPADLVVEEKEEQVEIEKKPKAEKKPKQVVSERGAFKNSDEIALVADENPHREGSKDRVTYAKLKGGMTVEEALTAGVDRAYLRYLVRRKLATIG